MTHVFSKKLQDMLMAVSGYKTPEEYVDTMMKGITRDRDYYLRTFTARAKVTAQLDDVSNGRQVTLSAFGMEVVNFTLAGYPACCGAILIHHFRCNRELTAKQFNPIMDQLIAELRAHGYIRHVERFITMMVEERRIDDPHIGMNLKPAKEPQMQYKPLWDYWHTCPKVNTRLMFNVNSGNVLHDMEVILK